MSKISGATVRDDFNSINTVLHYTRAAHFIGLWKSELKLIEQYLPDKNAHLLEAGCGAGRVAVGLWHQGYRNVVAFDFAFELVEQAENLAKEQGISGLTFVQADATALRSCHIIYDKLFDGALFMFNGLMQIPGRENRRAALQGIAERCRAGAHFIFTSHDRDEPNARELKAWAKEKELWARGEQDPRLLEFGDRYFSDDTGNTFMHLPDRREILDDMAATGWEHVYDATRNELASETPKVRNFSDNCRFWVAKKR
ncbi:class I SAM-dependent methyltransferase [Oleiharenicola lentus]|uniref:class I SAM-dependent methyltransferase n=1 Tax=Oleiharenicola lentus TaxID=2508720 RepID=UPI003F674B96